jgi:hypothetical protein
MPDQKPISLKKPSFNTVSEPFNEDENRIDWNRRNVGKKKQPDEVETTPLDEEAEGVAKIKNHRKKGKRDKRRQLVLDEELGRVVVKRRRKSNRNGEWHDDYE